MYSISIEMDPEIPIDGTNRHDEADPGDPEMVRGIHGGVRPPVVQVCRFPTSFLHEPCG